MLAIFLLSTALFNPSAARIVSACDRVDFVIFCSLCVKLKIGNRTVCRALIKLVELLSALCEFPFFYAVCR